MVIIQSKQKENLENIFTEFPLTDKGNYFQKEVDKEAVKKCDSTLKNVEVYRIDDLHDNVNKKIIRFGRWGQKKYIEIKEGEEHIAKNYLQKNIKANLNVIENSVFVYSLIRRVIINKNLDGRYFHKKLDRDISLERMCKVINNFVNNDNLKTIQNVHIDDFMYIYLK